MLQQRMTKQDRHSSDSMPVQGIAATTYASHMASLTDRRWVGYRADLVQDSHLEHKQIVEQDARVGLPRHMAQANLAHSKIALHLVLATLHVNANACS